MYHTSKSHKMFIQTHPNYMTADFYVKSLLKLHCRRPRLPLKRLALISTAVKFGKSTTPAASHSAVAYRKRAQSQSEWKGAARLLPAKARARIKQRVRGRLARPGRFQVFSPARPSRNPRAAEDYGPPPPAPPLSSRQTPLAGRRAPRNLHILLG